MLYMTSGDAVQFVGLLGQLGAPLDPSSIAFLYKELRAEVCKDFARPGVWNAINKLAARLQETDFVSGDEVLQILNDETRHADSTSMAAVA
jgi:hypothetical protein